MLFKKPTKKRTLFIYNNVIHSFTLGRTTNSKIAHPRQIILQHTAFSRAQLLHAHTGTGWTGLYADGRDKDNCIDCPLMGPGAKCYTHKPMQSLGMISSLRSMPAWEDISPYNEEHHESLVKDATGRFVRFGTYGEPSLLPFALIKDLTEAAKSWTSYTHQWRKYPLLAAYFMASVSSEAEAQQAIGMGWRVFMNAPRRSEYDTSKFIYCPATEKKDFSATCSTCGLCNGANRKRNIIIYNH